MIANIIIQNNILFDYYLNTCFQNKKMAILLS